MQHGAYLCGWQRVAQSEHLQHKERATVIDLLPFLPAQSLPKSHTPSAGYLRTVAHRSYTALEGEAQVTTSLPQLCTSLSRCGRAIHKRQQAQL